MLRAETRAHYTSMLDAAALDAQAAPDAPVLTFIATDVDPITVNRSDFRAEVSERAAALHAGGIGPGDLVVIAHTQSLESIYSFWGALLLGAIPSMFPTLTEKLDPALYMDSMERLVALSGVRAIVTTDEFAPQLAPPLTCPVYGSSDLHSGAAIPPAPPIDPHAVAFLQHSSGTTGLQKGVALSHEAVLNHIASYSDALALRTDDVIVSWLPLYHDMGLIAGFILPLMQGVPLILMSPFDWVAHPALLLRAITAYRGTLCWLPNFAYNHCARRIRQRDLEGIDLSTMRAFINCSEPVYAESHRLFLDRFSPHGLRPDQLAVSYAMAENVFAVTQSPIGHPPRHDSINRQAFETRAEASPIPTDTPDELIQVSCGPVIDGVEIRAVGSDGRPLPERRVGELTIRSNSLLSGYFRRDDLAPLTPDGWYRTGDIGYLADGEVYVVGRSKDLIIHAGKNIFPQDIEFIINTISGVYPGRVVVFGVSDPREGTERIAVVAEVTAVDDAQRQAIAGQIRQEVVRATGVTAGYVTLVDPGWLIKTSSGKIARAANRDKWLRQQHQN